MTNREVHYSDQHWTTFDGLEIVARQWLLTGKSTSSAHPTLVGDSSDRGTVLIIHGIGDHSGRFEHVADFLNQSGYSVLIPDLRGHGRSQGHRGYIRDFDILNRDIDYALQQARSLNPEQPCFLYGHSMGGLAALYFALKVRPDIRGLIVTSPALRILSAAAAWKVALGKTLRRWLPTLSLNSGLDINELSDDPQVAERIKSDRYRHSRITPGAFFGMMETGDWCLQNPQQVPCPTLLMHGKSDRITDAAASEEFAQACDDCQLRLWDHGKHELHNMTFREDVLAEIIRFQSRCNPADSPNKD